MNPKQAMFCDIENREFKELAPGVKGQSFWGDQMLMLLLTLEPGAAVGTHSHPNEQSGVVLEGEVTYTVQGEPRICKKGDMYIVPGDLDHSLDAHAGPAKVLEIFSPVRDTLMW